jgi:tetratricopeptide (TPR) repeat protein
MGKKSKTKSAIILISALVLFSGFIYGCYSKEAVPAEQTIYGQDNRPSPLSEEELRKFAASIRKVDGEAEAHYQLALYFQEKYRHKLAIDELKQVLLRSPGHAKAYNALGVSFDNLGDHDAAIDYYKLAINIDSKLDYAHNNLGYSYLLKGDMQKAAEAFQQAIALNGQEKRYRNNLGLVYAKQNKFEAAYEQFKALDTEANAEKMLVNVMKNLGKDAAAEKVLLAIRSAPKKEDVAQTVTPDSKLPELTAEAQEAVAGNDPVARFRSVNNSLSALRDPETDSDAQASAISDQSDAAKETRTGFSDEFVAEAIENSSKGPVITVPQPLTNEKSPYEIKIASTSATDSPQEAATGETEETKYYHVSSVSFSEDVKEAKKTPDPGRSIDYQAKGVARELREIRPLKVELATRIDLEEHEERILVAASAVKSGGWQNAPEPRQAAEKGIVEVEVANGNGVKGSAGKVAEHLRRNGFKVVRVMDAHSQDHFSTKVFYYGGNLKEAKLLIKAIPEISSDAELYELESMGEHVRLLIGKDLIERNNTLTWNKPRKMKSGIGG